MSDQILTRVLRHLLEAVQICCPILVNRQDKTDLMQTKGAVVMGQPHCKEDLMLDFWESKRTRCPQNICSSADRTARVAKQYTATRTNRPKLRIRKLLDVVHDSGHWPNSGWGGGERDGCVTAGRRRRERRLAVAQHVGRHRGTVGHVATGWVANSGLSRNLSYFHLASGHGRITFHTANY